MDMAARRKRSEKPVTQTAFAAALKDLHAKIDVGFAENGRRFDRVDGDIRVIRQEMGDMRQDITVLKADVAVLKDDVAVLKDDVAVLKDDVAVLKLDVAVLKSDVGVLKEDMGRVKDAGTQHTRELVAFRSAIATKVDRDEVEAIVEGVLARRAP